MHDLNFENYVTENESSNFELETITLGFLIPLSALGLIIGKKGQRLKGAFRDIEILIQRFNDKPTDSIERTVFLTGNFKNIITAQEVMLNIVKMKRPNFDRINSDCNEVQLNENEVLFRGFITWRSTGLLIGKDGTNIKSIHNETGCWIKIGHTEERVRGSRERQIYIQGPPESVAKAKLLVSARVLIQSISTTNLIQYYPVSFQIAEMLRNDNKPIPTLQEVSKKSGVFIIDGAIVHVLPIDEMETGENMTYIIVEGGKEANEVAYNLVDKFINEWKSTHVDADNNSIASDISEEQVVIRWCLPSDLVTFLFDDIINIQAIQQLSNIILHVLFNRTSTSLTSQATVLVMIGTLKDIFKAEQLILTKIYEIVQAPPTIIQLKNKIFMSTTEDYDVSVEADKLPITTSTSTTSTPQQPLPSSYPALGTPTGASNQYARNESRMCKNEVRRIPQPLTRLLSSPGESKSPNRNKVSISAAAYANAASHLAMNTQIINGNIQQVLNPVNNVPVVSYGSIPSSYMLSSSSSSLSLSSELPYFLPGNRLSTTLSQYEGRNIVFDENSEISNPAVFRNPGVVVHPGRYSYNCTLQPQLQLQQQAFLQCQEQERQQFLYWQSHQLGQLSVSYTTYPYSPSSHHHPYIPLPPSSPSPPSSSPYPLPSSQPIGYYSPQQFGYSPQHSPPPMGYFSQWSGTSPQRPIHYQPQTPYRNYYHHHTPSQRKSFPLSPSSLPLPLLPSSSSLLSSS